MRHVTWRGCTESVVAFMPAYDDRARESIERGDLLGSVDAQPGRVNEYGVCGSKNLSRQENSHFSLFGRTCNDPATRAGRPLERVLTKRSGTNPDTILFRSGQYKANAAFIRGHTRLDVTCYPYSLSNPENHRL